MYREGRLLLDELVTETYGVEDFEKAVADARGGLAARAVLTF
jgi:S-(hydroxymethyl)glutathione dehydrogenase/alcohol dehydrogenase